MTSLVDPNLANPQAVLGALDYAGVAVFAATGARGSIEHVQLITVADIARMARLGVAPEETIVLEDSVPGATSALAAGAFVYAVPALAQLDPHPRMVVSETALRETTWPELLQIWHDNSKVGI